VLTLKGTHFPPKGEKGGVVSKEKVGLSAIPAGPNHVFIHGNIQGVMGM
jgi:hypothetical protein